MQYVLATHLSPTNNDLEERTCRALEMNRVPPRILGTNSSSHLMLAT